MPEEERLTATQYDRWLARRLHPWAVHMRFLMGPLGAYLVNTGALRLPRAIGLQPHQRLLEIGCGRGSVLRLIGARVPFQTPPVGLDISHTMLRLSTSASQDGRSPHLLLGSATALPFPNHHFDVVITAHVIKHLSDSGLRECFAEVRRVLKDNGVFVTWEFTPAPLRPWDTFNRFVLTREVKTTYLRTFPEIADIARGIFPNVEEQRLGLFLYPPIPRVAALMRP